MKNNNNNNKLIKILEFGLIITSLLLVDGVESFLNHAPPAPPHAAPPVKSKPPPLVTTKTEPAQPIVHDKPKLNAVKNILEKAVNDWQPKKVPAQTSATSVPNNNNKAVPAGIAHSHLDPTHPKSFASKQNKLNQKGWFHYNHKVYSKQQQAQQQQAQQQAAAATSPLSSSPNNNNNNNNNNNDNKNANDQKKKEINNVASSIGNMQDAKGVKSTSISSKYKNGDRVGKTKSHGKHHVRHTVPGSIADRGPDGTGNTATRRQSAAIGSLVFIIVAGLAVLCAVGSLFTAP